MEFPTLPTNNKEPMAKYLNIAYETPLGLAHINTILGGMPFVPLWCRVYARIF